MQENKIMTSGKHVKVCCNQAEGEQGDREEHFSTKSSTTIGVNVDNPFRDLLVVKGPWLCGLWEEFVEEIQH